MDQVPQCSWAGTLVLCWKGNDYAEITNWISIAEVIERKLWVMYLAGLISQISARGLLRILERLGILERLQDHLEVTNYFLIHKSKRGSKQNFGWSKASAYSSDEFLRDPLRLCGEYVRTNI